MGLKNCPHCNKSLENPNFMHRDGSCGNCTFSSKYRMCSLSGRLLSVYDLMHGHCDRFKVDFTKSRTVEYKIK